MSLGIVMVKIIGTGIGIGIGIGIGFGIDIAQMFQCLKKSFVIFFYPQTSLSKYIQSWPA